GVAIASADWQDIARSPKYLTVIDLSNVRRLLTLGPDAITCARLATARTSVRVIAADLPRKTPAPLLLLLSQLRHGLGAIEALSFLRHDSEKKAQLPCESGKVESRFRFTPFVDLHAS